MESTGHEVLDLIASYADTWRLLPDYDENKLTAPSGDSLRDGPRFEDWHCIPEFTVMRWQEPG